MGRGVLSRVAHTRTRDTATRGGRSATHRAEERVRMGKGLDVSVDPKGYPHLGPVRLSLPRFDQREDGLWELTSGMPVPVETLLDGTGSMGHDFIAAVMAVLPDAFDAFTSGTMPVLGRYDVQIANAIFGDTVDTHNGRHVLCRTQFEMADKISVQVTNLAPTHGGAGNGKEDPQFGLFAAAYLTNARLWKYGLRGYHFVFTDDNSVMEVEVSWLKRIFGDDVLERACENGHDFSGVRSIPTQQVVQDLLSHTNAFVFLRQGNSIRSWQRLYGNDRCIVMDDMPDTFHLYEAVVIGLTEGIINLETAETFLIEHGADQRQAQRIVHAVSHIPLGAQTLRENFHRIPVAGDLFREKTDLWPLTADEIAAHTGEASDGASGSSEGSDKVQWL